VRKIYVFSIITLVITWTVFFISHIITKEAKVSFFGIGLDKQEMICRIAMGITGGVLAVLVIGGKLVVQKGSK